MPDPAWLSTTAANAESSNAVRGKNHGGQWHTLGVEDSLAKKLVLRGFKAPTPIQRSTIPLSLSTPARDVLGMARTGSGKTLAYLIPLLQRLGLRHRSTGGPRSLILCPTRELALQILKVGKDLGRGKGKEKEKGDEPLRWAVVIGGTALDEQFEAMSSEPDVVIATPGRFLHLAVEMSLEFRDIELMVYDEADRLFEMGFAVQLQEIVHRLPPTRQNLLFSATLPSTVAEFAKANLTNPALIRLDADANLSPDLEVAFLYLKPQEKDAALVVWLKTLLRDRPKDQVKNQAIVFAATKHHVEYIATLLRDLGFSTSFIYGSLDQIARQKQLQLFRNAETEILVVTDVAARGLDIPIMDNVINYDLPSSPRIFIHRVGRTARAGRKGTAASLVTRDDLPYLVDLDNFLNLKLFESVPSRLGTIPAALLDEASDSVQSIVQQENTNLEALRGVMRKGQGMYERSRSKASPNAYRSAKARSSDMAANGGLPIHPRLRFTEVDSTEGSQARSAILRSLQQFQPAETVLESGNRGGDGNAALMRERRGRLGKSLDRSKQRDMRIKDAGEDPEQAGPDEGANRGSGKHVSSKSYRDPSFFISHEKPEHERNKRYAVQSDDNFMGRLQASTLNLVQDEGSQSSAQKASQLKWDRSKKRFIAGSGVGADNKKMIRTESGALLPATFNSGRYAQWKKGRGRPSSAEGVSSIGHRNRSHSATAQHGAKTGTRAGTSPSTTTVTAGRIIRGRKTMDNRRAKNSRTTRDRK